jgi:hypothetical protein
MSTNNFNLAVVLLFCHLGCAFFVLVCGLDAVLEFLEFVRLGADALDFAALLVVGLL